MILMIIINHIIRSKVIGEIQDYIEKKMFVKNKVSFSKKIIYLQEKSQTFNKKKI